MLNNRNADLHPQWLLGFGSQDEPLGRGPANDNGGAAEGPSHAEFQEAPEATSLEVGQKISKKVKKTGKHLGSHTYLWEVVAYGTIDLKGVPDSKTPKSQFDIAEYLAQGENDSTRLVELFTGVHQHGDLEAEVSPGPAPASASVGG